MARSTMAKLGYPSEADYKDMLRLNIIAHCPVTPVDIDATNKIFDRKIPTLKMKTVRRNPPLVVSEYMSIG